MQSKIYSIYDSKVEVYLPPLTFRNRGESIRSVSEALKDPQHQFSKHSADFSLFELGDYDDASGNITLYPSKVNLGVLTEFLSLSN